MGKSKFKKEIYFKSMTMVDIKGKLLSCFKARVASVAKAISIKLLYVCSYW